MADENQNPEEPVIRDKRKIDPETGAVREPSSETDAAADAAASADEAELTVDDILNAAQAEVAEPNDEHLADLKRVTAEYANYRKRTEQNRELERDRAVGQTVAALLPVLDDLDRAEKHGDLEGDTAFGTIAAKLRQVTERLGLVRFGAVGDPFDPQLHEAIFQQPADDV
ncbi:nucleotide exchange factor GrpE, partial [Agromyces mediolanus]|uniref:nucleotide exchange factor GrpE n=1 Tax=Agromyces mediolanus TaxID=41986 RepID=UPI00203FFB2F